MKSHYALLCAVMLGAMLLPQPAAAVPIMLHAEDHPHTLPQHNAVELAKDPALQENFGMHLARHLAGATTGMAWVDELAFRVQHARLRLFDALGLGALDVKLTWRDGSASDYRMDANSGRKAKYLTGRSRDPNGNPLPDQSAAERAGAISFAGSYAFKTPRQRQDWVSAARAQDIQVAENGASATHLTCRWTGTELYCHTDKGFPVRN